MKLTEREGDEAREALANIVDQIGNYFVHSIAGGIGPLPDEPDKWGLVHMRTRDLITQLMVAKRALKGVESPKLLECGSGIGLIGSIAKELGFEAEGIEFSAEYIGTSRKLFPFFTVKRGDVLEHDFSPYDVVYYYGPFANDDLQVQMELKIEKEIRRGGIILANRKVSEKWRNTGEFEKLWDDPGYSITLRKLLEPIV